jgi:hypothetical protein
LHNGVKARTEYELKEIISYEQERLEAEKRKVNE